LSGPKIQEIMGPFFSEVLYRVCTDDRKAIEETVRDLEQHVALLITNGGTGMMERDNTRVALKPFLGRRIRPLERAVSAAMVQSCGPLAAIASPVVIQNNFTTIIALPGKTDEVEAALTQVIKPFFIHHYVYAKLHGL
jgi:molybdopterin biosynthesis enzyme MoaB